MQGGGTTIPTIVEYIIQQSITEEIKHGLGRRGKDDDKDVNNDSNNASRENRDGEEGDYIKDCGPLSDGWRAVRTYISNHQLPGGNERLG